jgi:hypothetical protein
MEVNIMDEQRHTYYIAEFWERGVNSISQFVLDTFSTLGVDADFEVIKAVTVVVLAFSVSIAANFIFSKKSK